MPVGSTVTYTVTIAPVTPGMGTPTGTVTLWDGNTKIGTATLDVAGIIMFSVTYAKAGTHNITASYTGDTNFTSVTRANSPVLTQNVV